MKDVVVNLHDKTVSATLTGNPLSADRTTYGAAVNYTGVVWTVGEIVGPTALPPAAVLRAIDGDTTLLTNLGYQILSNDANGLTVKAVNKLTNLQVTDNGFHTFAAALGIVEDSTVYNTLINVNNAVGGWGTLQSEVVFSTAVPEPSVYAMVGIGLAGVGFVAARRRRTAEQK